MSASAPATDSYYPSITQPSKHLDTTDTHPPPESKAPTSHDNNTLDSNSIAPTNPSSRWTSPHTYAQFPIRALTPGPITATFTCRIINISSYSHTPSSQNPQGATGHLTLLVHDSSATLIVKLYYASTTYDLKLGTLLTVWTTHIHSTSSLSGHAIPSAGLSTSVFPERDSGCHVEIHDEEAEKSDCCRTPLGYCGGDGELYSGLMSLETYINGNGAEDPDARLLVCVVAVGEIVTFTTKNGTPFRTLPITIADHSSQCTLSFPSPLFPSAHSWKPKHTVLLISHPRLLPSKRLTTTSRTQIDVDPLIPQTTLLRRHVTRQNCPINQPFPWHLFEIETIESSSLRLQYTWASLADWIADAPGEVTTGYISVILSEVNLMELLARKRVFSMECCDMPIYGSKTLGRCGQCGEAVDLRVNPDVVGGMADETGSVELNMDRQVSKQQGSMRKGHSKIVWSDEAWTQLLGRGPEELAAFCRDDVTAKIKKENVNVLRYLEQRLLWMRVVLLVGWTGDVEGGRVAVLKVVE